MMGERKIYDNFAAAIKNNAVRLKDAEGVTSQ
jgi:hypothetical protein